MKARFALIALALGVIQACASMTAIPTYKAVDGYTTTTTSGSGSWPELDQWPTAQAQASQDVAVIVAIEDYAFLPDVAGATSNANAWESYFRNARGMSEVYVLTDKQATAEEIRRFAEQAVGNANPDAALWFVFIGHGAALKDGSDGALIGMDAQQTVVSIGARSVPRAELVSTLEKGKQAQTVVILDACFSGRDSTGNLLAEGTQPVIPVSGVPSEVARGTVILSAAAGDEVAGQLPGLQRPAFTYMLLGAMRGWATQGQGDVSAEKAHLWTQQQFRNLKGRQQTPGIDGNGSLVLGSALGEADPGVAALMRGEGGVTTTKVEGGLLDTEKGYLFTQPQDWGFAPIYGPILVSLKYVYGPGEIHVEQHKMSQAEAAWMLDGSGNMDPIGSIMVGEPKKTEYGEYRGLERRVRDPDPNFGGEFLEFNTYQAGAAYRFVLKADSESALDANIEAFREFVAESVFQ